MDGTRKNWMKKDDLEDFFRLCQKIEAGMRQENREGGKTEFLLFEKPKLPYCKETLRRKRRKPFLSKTSFFSSLGEQTVFQDTWPDIPGYQEMILSQMLPAHHAGTRIKRKSISGLTPVTFFWKFEVFLFLLYHLFILTKELP